MSTDQGYLWYLVYLPCTHGMLTLKQHNYVNIQLGITTKQKSAILSEIIMSINYTDIIMVSLNSVQLLQFVLDLHLI